MLDLYLRKEPTTDALTLKYSTGKRRFDVVAYRDEARTQPAARWSWFYSTKPRPGAKVVTFNCYQWNAIWK